MESNLLLLRVQSIGMVVKVVTSITLELMATASIESFSDQATWLIPWNSSTATATTLDTTVVGVASSMMSDSPDVSKALEETVAPCSTGSNSFTPEH